MTATELPDDEAPRHLTAAGKDRRAEIVTAAEQLFSEHGYGRTRMTDIAEAAGVTKGLLYWYFESKQELIAEILLSTRQRLRDEQRTALEGLDDPLERIYVGTFTATRFILANYRLYRISGDGQRELAAVLGQSSQVHANDTAAMLADGQRIGVVRTDASPIAMAFANAGVVNNLCAAAFYRGVEMEPADLARTAAGYVLRACATDRAAAERIEADLREHGR